MECACAEFTYDGSHRCSDCKCKSSRHKSIAGESENSTLKSLERKNSNSSKKKYREKVNSVKGMSNDRTPMLLASQRRIAIIWCITSVIWIFTSMNNRPEKISRGIGDSVYLYASSVFFMGAFSAFMGYKVSKNEDKKRLSEILLLVNTIAMLSYLLQFLRVTPCLRDVNGYPVDFARYFEWLATCPTFISLISTLTRDSHYGQKTIAFDYMLVAAGFLGSILRSPYTYISLGVALGMFTQVITGLANMFDAAIEGKTKCRLDKVSLSTAKAVTLFSWICFPIIFFAVRFKVVSYGQGELLFAIADILSKVFVTILLVNASVEEIQNNKVEALVGIAEEMSVDLDKTEDLLGRMMPEDVISQLMSGEESAAQEFESVTVFFSDIANYTSLAGKTSAKDMLMNLNRLWIEYDTIAKKWGVYKVETIGDAYLGITGCPQRVEDHASRAANFALDIIRMIKKFKTIDGEELQIRIGLNSGPVTAGILGELNPHWCIVGDTVNIASRMESTSKPMSIHISNYTYELIKDEGFIISDPEIMEIKGKGTMKTYWVYGRQYS